MTNDAAVHTPGPWRFSDEPYGKRPPWEHVVGVDGRAVCTIAQPIPVCSAPASVTEAVANACLIAAAPDLLTALRQTLDAMRALRGLAFTGSRIPVERYPERDAANAADQAAVAAIDRAEGRRR